MKRTLILVAALAALALPLSAPAGTSAPATRLAGTTMDPMVITLKKAGTRVTRLKRGRYAITVSDRSRFHDFWIVGPGLRAKQLTTLGFVGRKTVTVSLGRTGRYEFYCRPHRSMGMRGYFRVT